MTEKEPKNQYKVVPLADDPAIANDDKLLRCIKTSRYIIPLGDNNFIVSPQQFTTQGSGCSSELESMFMAAGETHATRVAKNHGLAGAVVRVRDVRSTFGRIDAQKNPSEPLGVAYTPIPKDEPFGPNEYHCDIIPKFGMPGSRTLAEKTVIVELDVERVLREHAERHGRD